MAPVCLMAAYYTLLCESPGLQSCRSQALGPRCQQGTSRTLGELSAALDSHGNCQHEDCSPVQSKAHKGGDHVWLGKQTWMCQQELERGQNWAEGLDCSGREHKARLDLWCRLSGATVWQDPR
jgi:hypothetical protein